MATKYEGLTSAQWANRILDYNPGKFDKSALVLVKHYTAQQLGKFQEGGNIQLTKALKGRSTGPNKSADENAVKYIKTIKKAPSAPVRSGKSLEIEKFLRQVAAENGLKINFDTCTGGLCKKKHAPKKELLMTCGDSDDSDLESCDDEE